jgi:predicted phage terminase large subunit-like protein
MVVEFISWLIGKNPSLKTIYASFSENLVIRANLQIQKIMDSEMYSNIFYSKIGETRNRSQFSIVDGGYFFNTTIGGQVTGMSLDIGVIDDPIKGREEAGSQNMRDKIWDWFTDDFFSRFSEEGAMLAILTRWHIDDPIGRLKEKNKNIKVISYPAIAVREEKFRSEGEALFPEHKSVDFLLERKSLMASVNWEALYQQNPMIIGGEIIKVEHFKYYDQLPILKERMIFADTAQKTKENNDFSVFQCWGRGEDNKIYLIDQIRGKWEAPDLKTKAVAFWNKHQAVENGALRNLQVEDKASGTGLMQEIKREGKIPIKAIQRSTDKYTRILDVVGYIESGYVILQKNAPFLNDFLSECEEFSANDSHKHDDQIDPMIDAITIMLAKNKTSQWSNLL